VKFEWHGTKAAANMRKHGVSFDEAATVFADTLSHAFPDQDHSDDETPLPDYWHVRGRAGLGCLSHGQGRADPDNIGTGSDTKGA
jgi:hypothetical protein